jgi:hypothetical protein
MYFHGTKKCLQKLPYDARKKFLKAFFPDLNVYYSLKRPQLKEIWIMMKDDLYLEDDDEED